jgi:hypothetical protein
MVRKLQNTGVTLLCVVLLQTFILSDAWAGRPGDAGLLSLRLGIGSRESAMGSAGVAASRGAAAVYWNPALLAYSDYNTELLLQHQEWLGLFNKESATLAHRLPFAELGFLFSGFYSQDIERYGNEPVGVPEGTFRPYDVTVGLSLAREIVKNLSLGVMAKYLYQKIDVYDGSVFAFDFFLAHQAVIEGLTFGASYTNYSPWEMTLREEPILLPEAFRLGVAFDPGGAFFADKVTFTGDLIMPNDGNEKAHVGAEVRLLRELALRVGTNVNYDSQGLTAGAGFRKGALGIGYAYEEMKNELDSSHKFTLELYY